MNEVIRTIRDRRSIRAYKNDQISDDQLNIILNAGEYAASGMGEQKTIMVAVQDPTIIAQMSGLNAKVMGMD
jgi:nitroreductase